MAGSGGAFAVGGQLGADNSPQITGTSQSQNNAYKKSIDDAEAARVAREQAAQQAAMASQSDAPQQQDSPAAAPSPMGDPGASTGGGVLGSPAPTATPAPQVPGVGASALSGLQSVMGNQNAQAQAVGTPSQFRPNIGTRNPPSLQGLLQVRSY